MTARKSLQKAPQYLRYKLGLLHCSWWNHADENEVSKTAFLVNLEHLQ